MAETVAAAATDGGARAQFTCTSCSCVFETFENMKEHYKSDWHRLNLKRKVAGLPPLSLELSAKQHELLQAHDAAQALAQGGPRSTRDNRRVQRAAAAAATSASASASTSSAAAGGNMAQKQHKAQSRGPIGMSVTAPVVVASTGRGHVAAAQQARQMQAAQAQKGTESEAASQVDAAELAAREEEARLEREVEEMRKRPRLPIEASLFDNHVSASLEENIKYMIDTFGFHLPEIKYLVDVPGLIEYLQEKVAIGYSCVFCSKRFRSLEAVRHHMVSKNHCRMDYVDHADEFLDFYDFRSSYGNAQRAGRKTRRAVTASAAAAAGTGVGAENDGADAEEDGSWEDFSGSEDEDASMSDDGDDEGYAGTRVRLAGHGLALIVNDQHRIYHRSMLRYLKQKVPHRDEKTAALVNTIMLEYDRRGVPSTALTTMQARQQAREQRQYRHYLREQNKAAMQMGVQTNILYIKRPQYRQ